MEAVVAHALDAEAGEFGFVDLIVVHGKSLLAAPSGGGGGAELADAEGVAAGEPEMGGARGGAGGGAGAQQRHAVAVVEIIEVQGTAPGW